MVNVIVREQKIKKGKTTLIDAMVGTRVRLRRKLIGMTQEQLATSAGLTFQQIQKYERGMNRISASRLYDFSHILKVPVNYFFDDGIIESTQELSEDPTQTYQIDPLARRDTMELLRAYLKITDEKIRKKILDLMKVLAEDIQITNEMKDSM